MKRYVKRQANWYIYMIFVDNKGVKSKHYGRTNCYYTGIALDLIQRLKQHITGYKSKFIRKNYPNATKKLVYVEYFTGNEHQAIQRENTLKHQNHERKKNLINSGNNKLIRYIPFKCVILRNPNSDGEIALKW